MTEVSPRSGPELFLVLDAADADRLAAFWAAALHYRRVDRMDQYEVLVPEQGTSPVLLVQEVPDPTPGKGRMHLDLHVADPAAEVARLQALGATVRGQGSLGDISWTCLADPEGNVFDVGLDA